MLIYIYFVYKYENIFSFLPLIATLQLVSHPSDSCYQTVDHQGAADNR